MINPTTRDNDMDSTRQKEYRMSIDQAFERHGLSYFFGCYSRHDARSRLLYILDQADHDLSHGNSYIGYDTITAVTTQFSKAYRFLLESPMDYTVLGDK